MCSHHKSFSTKPCTWGLEQYRSAQRRRVAQGSTERRHEVVKNTRSPETTTTGMTTTRTHNHQHLDYVGAKLKQQPMMPMPPASHSTTPTTSQSTPSMICTTYGAPPLNLLIDSCALNPPNDPKLPNKLVSLHALLRCVVEDYIEHVCRIHHHVQQHSSQLVLKAAQTL